MPVGGHRDVPAIRRPCRVQLGIGVVGELLRAPLGKVEQEQIALPVARAGNGQLPPIGRPGHGTDGLHPRHANALLERPPHGIENRQLRIAGARHHHDVLTRVRGPRPRRIQEGNGIGMAITGEVPEGTHVAPGGHVAQSHVHLTKRVAANVGQPRSIGAQLRVEGETAALRRRAQRGADDIHVLPLLQEGAVRRENVRVPVVLQRLHRYGQGAHDAGAHAHPHRVAEQRRHGVITEAPPDVRPEGVPVAIGEQPRIRTECIDARQLAGSKRGPQPHGGVGVVAAERHVLGHPFHEPERQLHQAVAAPHLPCHVELKEMRDLVPQHMVVLGAHAGERHDQPVTQRLGEPARPLAERRVGQRGLLEVGMIRVQHQRLALGEGVAEQRRQALVPPLRLAGRFAHRGLGGLVEVNVEVRRAQHLHVEPFPAHAILSEVLRVEWERQPHQRCGQTRKHPNDARSHTGAPSRSMEHADLL